MMNNIFDVLFFALVAVCFGTIIWYNITEISKARKQLKQRARAEQCRKNN